MLVKIYSENTRMYLHTNLHTHTHIYIYIHIQIIYIYTNIVIRKRFTWLWTKGEPSFNQLLFPFRSLLSAIYNALTLFELLIYMSSYWQSLLSIVTKGVYLTYHNNLQWCLVLTHFSIDLFRCCWWATRWWWCLCCSGSVRWLLFSQRRLQQRIFCHLSTGRCRK